ncbi:SDR family NAD(P)-dependent oxidoreductase [Microvirga antarctica]|uniref:SDR family NAD(P)-dependent oxidoreductase n=1 Tax=Microvirga antarctica TaxID=2819233 RepID=UPI001B302A40|nr:SDR family oxidoreductase [Microvirga antarctica]
MSEFDRQVCVVTGGGRGIGRAIVAMFAAEGAHVHSLDTFEQAPLDGHVSLHKCDIADLSAVEAFFAQLGADCSLDILVNNAATVTRAVPITELSAEEWQRTLAVNVTGVFNVTRSALGLMGSGGRIINLASTFAHVGSPGRVAYSTTKGAILAFTRSLALDTAALGIRVNSISPGGIATDRLIELFGSEEAAEAHLAPLHPIGHTGKPADIANAVWYLASQRATFITGADLRVDGGYTAQ